MKLVFCWVLILEAGKLPEHSCDFAQDCDCNS